MTAYELVNLLEDLIECGELDLDAKVIFFDDAYPEDTLPITKYSVEDPNTLMLFYTE